MAEDAWAVECASKEPGHGWNQTISYHSSRRAAKARQSSLISAIRQIGVVGAKIPTANGGNFYGAMFDDTERDPKQHTLYKVCVYEKPTRSYP